MKIASAMIALSLSLASSVSMAGGFDGPFVQAGIGFAGAQTEIDTHWSDVNVNGKFGDGSFVGQIAAGYSHSWGQFSLAASAYYIIGDQKAGSIYLSTAQYGVNTYEFKNTNTWGITIDPGINLNDSTLAYVKLGYGQTAGKGSEVFQRVTYAYDATYGGFSYGAGIKYRFTPNLYGVAEILQSDYDRKTWSSPVGSISLKPSSLIGIIGLGYKF